MLCIAFFSYGNGYLLNIEKNKCQKNNVENNANDQTAKKDNNDDDCDVVLEIYTISQPNWCWLALVGGCGGHIPDYHHDNIESYAAIPTTEAAANYGEYLFISIMCGYAIIILIIILDHFISLLNVFLSFF